MSLADTPDLIIGLVAYAWPIPLAMFMIWWVARCFRG
jgi:hypothetical protein